jgi:hypothetical protein
MAGEAEQLELPEVVVKVEPDAQAAPEVIVKTEIKDPAVKDLVDQYKELEAKSEEQRIAKEAAQTRASAAQRDAEQARHEADIARAAVASSNLDTITTALSSAQAEAEAAKRDIKGAIASGDSDAQTDAYERLAKATTLAARYDEAKADLEARKAAPIKRAVPDDPVEAYIQGRTEPTANWLRDHSDFVTDKRKNAKLTSAHWDAVGEGIAPDTKEYFEHVEKFIGLRKADAVVTDGDNVQRPGAKKPAQRAVAPVNGSAGSGGAVERNEVRLSAREAEAATDGTHQWNYDDPSGQKKFKKGDPIGVQEFARRKQKMTQQGQYDRSYETQ